MYQGDDEGKAGPESLTRTKPIDDVIEDDNFKNGTGYPTFTDQVERGDENERKTGPDLLTRTETANDAHEDENLKEGTKESAKPESGENPEIKEGENNGFDTFNELVGETCEETLHKKSNLNVHMQKMLNMADGSQKGENSDELTPDVLEKEDNDKDDDESKTGLKSLAGKEPANNVLKDDRIKHDTEMSVRPKQSDNKENKEGENSRLDLYYAAIDEACEKTLKE